MAARRNADLFLQITGSSDGLVGASKVGRTALLGLVGTANDVATEVQKAFADMGNGPVKDELKTLEQSFDRTFRKIRENARAALDAPDAAGAATILNASGADRNAAAAEAQAGHYRILADAAAVVATRAGDAGKSERVLAVALETQAIEAEHAATALRAQATILGAVAAQAGVAANANDAVAEGHKRMGTSGMIMQHVVRSTTDSFAAGLPATMIFAEQIGRLGEAATFAAQEAKALGGDGGALGKMAGFLTGPWGLALTVSVSILATLAGKLLETKETVEGGIEKLKKDSEQTEITRKAKERYAHTVEGVADAIRAGTEATEASIKAEKTSAEQANITAKANLAEELSIRQKTQARLADARALLAAQVQRGTQGTTQGSEGAAFGIAGRQSTVDALDKQLAENDARIKEAQARVGETRIALATEAADRAADPLKRIAKLYDDQAAAARKAAREQVKAGHDVAMALTHQLTQIERNRKAAIEAEQARQTAAKKKPAVVHQFGRQITLSDAQDIIHGIGGRVTSGYRSTAQQQVLYDRYKAGKGPLAARPGTSEHESGQAVDIAKTAGMSLAAIKKAFEAKGVRLSELLDEGDHFHAAWGKKGPSAAVTARRQQAAVVKDANDDRAYQGDIAQAQARIASARLALADTIEERNKVAVAELRAALVQKDLGIDDEVRAGKISAAQALRLKIMEGSAEQLGEQLQAKKLADAQMDRRLGIERDQLTGQITILELQDGLATSLRDRRRIAQQILDAEEKIARDTLQAAIAKEDDPQRRAALAGQLDNVGPTFDLRREQVNRQNAGPLDNYRQQLKSQVGDINQALQGVEVDAIGRLGDSFEGAAAKALGLHGVIGDIIGDLLKVGEQKLLFALVGGASSGGLLGGLLHFADGGAVAGPGGPREDRILARLSAGEYVVNAAAYARHPELVEAINSGELARFADGGLVGGRAISLRALPDMGSLRQAPAGGTAPITFDLRGAVMTADLLRQMNDLSARHATIAVVAGAEQARQNAADDAFARIPA